MANKEAEKKDYEKLKSIAEGMFIEQNMTSRDIASALGISEVTVSRWRQGTDGRSWDEKKKFVQLTPSRLREKLLKEAENVADGGESVIKADVIVKLLAGAEKLAAKATPEVVHAVLNECCMYIAGIDPKFALQMAKYHRMFLQYKIEQES